MNPNQKCRDLLQRSITCWCSWSSIPFRGHTTHPFEKIVLGWHGGAQAPPTALEREVNLGGGLFVCGDHHDTATFEGRSCPVAEL